MKSTITKFSIVMAIGSLLLAACGSLSLLPGQVQTEQKAPAITVQQPAQPQTNNSGATTSLSGYETALENIYAQVNPAVVSIRVVQQQDTSALNSLGQNNPFSNIPGLPNFFFGTPGQNNNQPSTPQYSQALGSGFVWNKDGYIVTNNHVVNGANKIEVKFADGTTLTAKLIGTDPDSDLAVIKVDNPGFTLTPITLSGSTAVKVGQIAVAIGNPFGLENTMTTGIVSALGRTLPANESNTNGASFSIPDIIQTDASINPGNSGGPLVDDQGGLIGVNTAIASSSNSNSGVGFAIPSTIVSRVIPALILNGKYEHPYLGIKGTSITPDIATAMKLDATQRGALVEEITPNSPADKAGLQGSDRQTTIDGNDINIGGDLITAIDGTPVKTMDDLIAYLADHTDINQKVTLTILRGGKEKSVDVTLEARPAQTAAAQSTNSNSNAQAHAWLGIAGQSLTAEINKEMKLADNQAGILVEQVQAGSPADQAGLHGSFKPVLINGQRVLIGGDVITAIDGNSLVKFEDLQAFLQNAKPGQEVKLTILRDGSEQTLTATLAEHP
jgi:Do/DeqQ family serine protease